MGGGQNRTNFKFRNEILTTFLIKLDMISIFDEALENNRKTHLRFSWSTKFVPASFWHVDAETMNGIVNE